MTPDLRTLALIACLLVSLGSGAVQAEDQGGAATPQEAAESLLSSWKAQEAPAFLHALKKENRGEMEKFLSCTKLEDYTLDEVRTDNEDPKRVTIPYRWKISVDGEALGKILIASAKADAEKKGDDPEVIAKQLKVLEALLPGMVPLLKARIEKAEQVMVLEQIEGLWFVSNPIQQQTQESQNPEAQQGRD